MNIRKRNIDLVFKISYIYKLLNKILRITYIFIFIHSRVMKIILVIT